jgi:hypothetical protein
VPDGWRTIVEQRKTLFGWPVWSDVQPLPTGVRVRTTRHDIHTASAEITRAVVQLADSKGVGLEAVRLRLTAWAFRRHQDVTATLEVEGGRSFVTIARVDAWPSDPHMNSRKARRLSGLRNLEAQIDTCHVHRFADNAKLGRSAFGAGLEGNLPIAVRIGGGGLGSFRDFLRTVGTEFNIGGLENIQPPNGWQTIL